MPLTANCSVTVSGQHTSVLDLGTAALPFSLSANIDYANGTGANQADKIFTDTRTLAGSASETLDLNAAAGTPLVDAFGQNITFVTIKLVAVKARTTNTNDVLVSRGATNGVPLFTAVSAGVAGLKPGGIFVWAVGGTGLGVTAATADLITITNGAAGTNVDYDIIIIGTSA